MLKDKGIIMGEWPEVRPGNLLVMDEWGCSARVIRGMAADREESVEEWAREVDRDGGWSGDPYPQGDRVYAIDCHGLVTAHTLHTEFEPNFYANRHELPAPKGVVWC